MSDREVWEKASTIAAAFRNDDQENFAARFFDILRENANPQDWRRVAAAVDIIAAATRH